MASFRRISQLPLISIFVLLFCSLPSYAHSPHRSQIPPPPSLKETATETLPAPLIDNIPRGGAFFVPAGYNPFGYQLTTLGEEFLKFDGSLDSDVGRFLASLKQRKRFSKIKEQWLEIVRVSKTGQSMRILRNLQDLVDFCVKAGLID